MVNPKWGDLDVFATARDEKKIVVSYLLVRNGSIANSGTHAFDIRMEETEEEVLAQSILHFQKLYNSESLELILPYQLEYGFSAFRITVPKSGEKKKLLDIAMKNAGHLIEDLKKKRLLHLGSETNSIMLLEKLRDALYLQDMPTHIECFDNSNFQGSNPVSAMVCFRDGNPSKKIIAILM